MSSGSLPPDPCLVAVMLVIRSRDGPHFVFHYPPRPDTKPRPAPKLWGTELDVSDSGSESDDGADDADDPEDIEFRISQNLSKLDVAKKARQLDPWDGDDHYRTTEGRHVVPWEHLFEFETRDLESILTPGRAYNKKKFMLTLDPLTYISYPIHIRKDGQWKKKKKKRDQKPAQSMADSIMSDKTLGPEAESSAKEPAEATPSPTASPVPPAPADAEDGGDGDDNAEMTMFNVVFVTNPQRREKEARNIDIYEHVAKKINKALKYAQATNNYVWTQSELILGMKERAREEHISMSALWNQVLDKSPLAQALQDVYEAISRGKIANIHFGSETSISLSVQIPMPFFISSLPESYEQAMPGVWVTTATGMELEDGIDHTVINKHFALLLLDDQEKLIAEIQAEGGELAAPLIEYIKISKPTMSFAQVAQAHSISLSDIRDLAQHLIYWRRALAIPPLHHRDIYIASPNTDNHQLPAASLSWAKSFPLAPPLPSFLAALSLGPRPYKTFAPSKVHRPTYMEMLAWLVRGGWVVNLRTYVRIIVWPEIIYEVHHAIDADQLRRETDPRTLDVSPTSSPTGSVASSPKGKEKERDGSLRDRDRERFDSMPTAAEAARLSRLTSTLAALRAEFAALPQPTISEHPSMVNPPHIQHIAPHIISDPNRAGEIESLYLEAIAQRLAGSTFTAGQAQGQGQSTAQTQPLPVTRKDSSLSAAASASSAASSSGTNGANILNPNPGQGGNTNGGMATGPAAGTVSNVTAQGANMSRSNSAQQDPPHPPPPGLAPPSQPSMTPEAEKKVKAFRRLQKYCDGRTALEMVGTMEGIKRKEVWNLMMNFEEYLVAWRHW